MPKITNNYSNEQLEDAAYKKTGTAPTEIPLNSDLGTAAYKDVQTNPSDATPEAVLNNETTHIGGEINFTGANYQPEISSGLAVVRLMRLVSGAGLADGALAPLLGVEYCRFSSAGALLATGVTAAGIWRNVTGTPVNNLEYGMFERES